MFCRSGEEVAVCVGEDIFDSRSKSVLLAQTEVGDEWRSVTWLGSFVGRPLPEGPTREKEEKATRNLPPERDSVSPPPLTLAAARFVRVACWFLWHRCGPSHHDGEYGCSEKPWRRAAIGMSEERMETRSPRRLKAWGRWMLQRQANWPSGARGAMPKAPLLFYAREHRTRRALYAEDVMLSARARPF